MPQTQYIVYLVDGDEDDLEALTTALNDLDCITDVQCFNTPVGFINR